MWEYFEVLLKRNNLRISDVQKGTGIPYSTFTDWKAGRYTQKMDTIKRQKTATPMPDAAAP